MIIDTYVYYIIGYLIVCADMFLISFLFVILYFKQRDIKVKPKFLSKSNLRMYLWFNVPICNLILCYNMLFKIDTMYESITAPKYEIKITRRKDRK
jgi:hypothetical protein